MNTLADLYPTGRPTVMALLGNAGHDTSDWKNFNGASPASNPRYCYEWAFEQLERPPVVNLPHEEMLELEGHIVFKLNLRALSSGYGARPPRSTRMNKLARVLARAHAEKLAVRVIAFAGELGDRDEPEGDATRVTARRLDPLPWTVTKYDVETGDCVLTRGALARAYVDQFAVTGGPLEPPERRESQASAFIRNPAVRQRVLERAAGHCQLCGKRGFAMRDGAVYLETHHVLPLSEGGRDIDSNVVALCANHHREAHHGAEAIAMRAALEVLAAVHASAATV
jgi:5-methylcytosine-specific restriction protein A